MAVAFSGDHDVAFTTTFTAYANKGFADRPILPKAHSFGRKIAQHAAFSGLISGGLRFMSGGR
jgi:hypothetical protein